MKNFFFDVETTGTRHWQNGIHQISGCIEINGIITEDFNFRVQPYREAVIEDAALIVSGTTRQDLESYLPIRDCHAAMLKLLDKYVDRYNPKDKFFLIGYNNTGFDNNFFRAWFKHNENEFFGSYFWSNSIDVMVLASQLLIKSRHKMTDFKQSTVAKYLGIKVDPSRLHDAAYDVELLRQIYYFVTGEADDLM